VSISGFLFLKYSKSIPQSLNALVIGNLFGLGIGKLSITLNPILDDLKKFIASSSNLFLSSSSLPFKTKVVSLSARKV